jgi:hypothetical protein
MAPTTGEAVMRDGRKLVPCGADWREKVDLREQYTVSVLSIQTFVESEIWKQIVNSKYFNTPEKVIGH